MLKDLRPAAVAVLVFTLLLGLAYPLAMTGIAQVVFPNKANGSVIEREGKPVGSRLIGQDFSRDTGEVDDEDEPILEADPTYFQSRPSATGYAPDGTFFNNLGPNQKDLATLIDENLAAYVEREGAYVEGLNAGDVPVDAVTTSASGVDPHISEDNARIQSSRIAEERGIEPARLRELIDKAASRPLLGLGGEKSINVLELNLALDKEPL